MPVLFRTSRPGSGGVTRGRGDAALTFGESSEREAEFAVQALPKARFAENRSERIGVATGAPKVAPIGEAPAAGASSDADGAPSPGRRIAPRHRDAVRSFFGASKNSGAKNEK